MRPVTISLTNANVDRNVLEVLNEVGNRLYSLQLCFGVAVNSRAFATIARIRNGLRVVQIRGPARNLGPGLEGFRRDAAIGLEIINSHLRSQAINFGLAGSALIGARSRNSQT